MKEKKVSVTIFDRKNRVGEKVPYCRVVYDRKNTAFKLNNFQLENENEFIKEIESIVRFESDVYGSSFQLKGISERIPIYKARFLKSFDEWLMEDLSKNLEDVLTYKKFKFLFDSLSRGPVLKSTGFNNLDFVSRFLLGGLSKLIYIQFELNVDLSKHLPPDLFDQVEAFICYSFFELNSFPDVESNLKLSEIPELDGVYSLLDFALNESKIIKEYSSFLENVLNGKEKLLFDQRVLEMIGLDSMKIVHLCNVLMGALKETIKRV